MASSSAAPPLPPPPWGDLPPEITSMILQKIGAVEILTTAQKVCKSWYKICKEPATWRVIDMRNALDFPYDMEKMCRYAVDLSQGQLIAINIEFFGTDELLAYIAERSGQLRRLRIVSGFNLLRCLIWGDGLSDACKKFPLLEELHLFYCHYIDGESIKAVGNSCPMLRSFKFNRHNIKYPIVMDDEEALAVASSMSKLHHLQLYGNNLTNEGLTAILDGCPELKSIDLRKCRNLDLEGDLGTRCLEQIENRRLPHDDPEDYEYYTGPSGSDESSDDGYPYGFSDMEVTSNDAGSETVYVFSDMEEEYVDSEYSGDDIMMYD